MKLSICMIVKDEEEVLERCLMCASKIADEIIIVDTGSVDKTKDIAKKYTSSLYDYKWNDDFAAARNFSFSKANNEYIMWLDADDVINNESIDKINNLKQKSDTSVDIFMLKYNVAFDENELPIYSYYRERIIRNSEDFKWLGTVHEAIKLEGKVEYTDICIEHKKIKPVVKGRNLRIYRKMLESKVKFSTRQKFYYARELYFNGLYNEAIEYFTQVLKENDIPNTDKINACLDLHICYKINRDLDNSLMILFETFKYDTPRPDICCYIGNFFFEKNDNNNAIFWYELATKLDINVNTTAFINIDMCKFIPYMQLCVCYYNIGNIKKSKLYNKRAEKIKPNDKTVKYNNNFFKTI